MKSFKIETNKLNQDLKHSSEMLNENKTKIKQNKQLPWLVSNIVEILDIPPEQDDDGNVDLD